MYINTELIIKAFYRNSYLLLYYLLLPNLYIYIYSKHYTLLYMQVYYALINIFDKKLHVVLDLTIGQIVD